MPVFAFYVADVGWRKGWRDKVIRWATGHPASHVEYVVGGDLGKSNVCISASKRDGNKVRSKPYDTWGALLSVTPFNRHKLGAWFCSEIMAHSLSLPEPHRFTPGSLLNELCKSEEST